MKINIGKSAEGNCEINLEKLIATRLLINASSGGGKSWIGRKMMEESAGKVQQIILDVEGDFATLREKYDFLLVGKDGEIPANIRTAEMLARKLWEIKASTIIDISELRKPDQHTFVKRFLEALIDSPKKLWTTPILLYIDEAQIFAPEGKSGKSEAKPAVVDVLSRGRKRGISTVLMTQRISKLDKDAAAECQNQMNGLTVLDIDRKRASENLGFTSKKEELSLRDLSPGTFHVFGPCFNHQGVKLIEVGPVQTTHPDRTKGIQMEVPPTPENVKKLLKDVIDLPKEAEEELKTKQDLKNKIVELKRELRTAINSRPKPEIDQEKMDAAIMRAKATTSTETMKLFMNKENEYKKTIRSIESNYKQLEKKLLDIGKIIGKEVHKLPPTSITSTPIPVPEAPKRIPMDIPVSTPPRESKLHLREYTSYSDIEEKPFGLCARKIYSFLVANPEKTFSRVQLAMITGYSHNSGGFKDAISRLYVARLVTKEGQRVSVLEVDESVATEDSSELSVESWTKVLGRCARQIFKILLENPYENYSREDMAEITNYSSSSGGFKDAISKLNVLGLLNKNGQNIILNPEILEL